MSTPDDLKYTKEHEWVRLEDDDLATVGITAYAQEQLGEIVHLELPDQENEVEQEDSFGVVESVKSVSDLYSPLTGIVVEINEHLLDNPEVLNDDCYSEGWMIKVKLAEPKELDGLMNAEEYNEFIKEEEEA